MNLTDNEFIKTELEVFEKNFRTYTAFNDAIRHTIDTVRKSCALQYQWRCCELGYYSNAMENSILSAPIQEGV